MMCLAAVLAITGIAHVAVRVDNLTTARRFYRDLLGFAEPFQFTDNGRTTVAFIKVNDRQYIELYPGLNSGQEKIAHVCLETDDIEAVYNALQAAGLTPAKVSQGRAGNLLTNVRDPDGNLIEFLQYKFESLHTKANGQGLGPQRISTHLAHVAFPVKNRVAALGFYRDKLGFTMMRAGSRLYMRMPGESGDVIELLPASPNGHIALQVPDLAAAWNQLITRGLPESARASDLADPDGTVVELMTDNEPRP